MNAIKLFFQGFIKSLFKPFSLYRDIEKGKSYYSWICVLVYCLIYVFASLWLYFNGYEPFVNTWIKIPEDIYYLVQSFYILPVIFFMWILATGIIHIISKLFKGNGRVPVLFKMTGYSLWAPWYILFIFDCIHSIPEIVYNIVLIICIVLVIFNTVVAAWIEEKINIIGAILSTLVAFTSIGVITFTYIR